MQLSTGFSLMVTLVVLSTLVYFAPWAILILLGLMCTLLFLNMVLFPPTTPYNPKDTIAPAQAPAADIPAQNLLYEETTGADEEELPSQTQLLNTTLSYGGDFNQQPRLPMVNRREVTEATKKAKIEAQRITMLQLNPSIFKGEDRGRYLFTHDQAADYEAAQHITTERDVRDRRFASSGAPSTLSLVHLQRAIDVNTFQNNYQTLGGYNGWAANAAQPMLPFVNPHHTRDFPAQRTVQQTAADFAFPGLRAPNANPTQMPDQANWQYAHGHHGLFPDGYIA